MDKESEYMIFFNIKMHQTVNLILTTSGSMRDSHCTDVVAISE